MRPESMEAANAPNMPRETLTLVAQLPELPHLGVGHRQPAAEEDRHALVAIALRLLELLRSER